MLSTIVIVFSIVFLVTFLGLFMLNAGSSRELKQTMARLDDVAVAAPTIRTAEPADILREDILSDIPWLNDLLNSSNVFPAMRTVLKQANLDWKLSAVILFSVFLGGVATLLTQYRTDSWLVSCIVGAVVSCCPWLYVLHARSERFGAFEERLPEALDLMVSAIRAGHGFASAINLASRENSEPISGELRQCSDEQNFGLDLPIAMNNLADRVPIPDVQLLVAAVLIQKESGCNLAEILEKAAYIIRERFRLKRQVRVHTAQGRMTGWVLTFMPVILGLLLYILDPDRMSVLWSRPIGVKLMWTAAAMDIIGALIIRKIVRTRI